MSGQDALLVVVIGAILLVALGLTMVLLLKQASARRASYVRHTEGPARWSSLELQERARLQSKPKRLRRSHPVISPWETSQKGERGEK
jgi:hypothetical protein